MKLSSDRSDEVGLSGGRHRTAGGCLCDPGGKVILIFDQDDSVGPRQSAGKVELVVIDRFAIMPQSGQDDWDMTGADGAEDGASTRVADHF
jgi:hypothetical protein